MSFAAWFDSFTEPYKPLMDGLTAAFGVPFTMQHTGGGCMAIEAMLLEGQIGLMITDAEDVLGSMEERVTAEADGQPLGFAVGVYPLEKDDQFGWLIDSMDALAFVTDPDAKTVDDVTALIRRGISEAIRSRN